MFFRIAVYVFLFLIRLRFPSNKSISEVIRERYNAESVKNIRKFEKKDYRLRKTKLDLDFLEYCERNELIPNFLRFKVANRNLQGSQAYKQCQLRLLSEEISQKKSQIRNLSEPPPRRTESNIISIRFRTCLFPHSGVK